MAGPVQSVPEAAVPQSELGPAYPGVGGMRVFEVKKIFSMSLSANDPSHRGRAFYFRAGALGTAIPR
jgi:hypothetical protein